MTKVKILNGQKPNTEMDIDGVRDVLSWVVTDFVEGQAARSERYFYPDEIEGLKRKVVKVTFEYIDPDSIVACDGGETK